jgi:hypothetical protein
MKTKQEAVISGGVVRRAAAHRRFDEVAMATVLDEDLHGKWKFTCSCSEVQYLTFNQDRTVLVTVDSSKFISKLNSIFNNDFMGYWELKWAPVGNTDKRIDALYEGPKPISVDIIKLKITHAKSGLLAVLNEKPFLKTLFPVLLLFGAPKKSLFLLEKKRSGAFNAAYNIWHHGLLEKL